MSQKLVLVIDDDDGIREIIRVSLEAIANWDVITASSGNEGFILANSRQPDIILLDVMMPYVDGIATFQKLQANSQTKNIPTIFLTAKAQISEQRQYRDLGVTGVIIKPFAPYDLVAKIKAMVGW